MIVPLAPGGSIDTVARMLAQKMALLAGEVDVGFNNLVAVVPHL